MLRASINIHVLLVDIPVFQLFEKGSNHCYRTYVYICNRNRDLSGIVDQFVAGMVGAVDITLSYLNNATEVAIDNMLKFNIPSIFNENVISVSW